MWYTDWNPSVNQAVSRDGGLTWEGQLEVIDTTDVLGVKIIEPGVIRSPKGRQLLMLIRDFARGGKYNSPSVMTRGQRGPRRTVCRCL